MKKIMTMKKIIMMFTAAVAVMSVKAAAVDWKVGGAAAQDGYTVYVLTSLADKYENVAALASAAVANGTIGKNGRSYYASGSAQGASVTADSMKDAYFVIIESDSATSYTSYKADMSAFVYDPNNQESSPGVFNSVSAETILSSGTTANYAAAPLPEPTSGLLMLLGMAGFALRRKRA